MPQLNPHKIHIAFRYKDEFRTVSLFNLLDFLTTSDTMQNWLSYLLISSSEQVFNTDLASDVYLELNKDEAIDCFYIQD
jgi:hypothetical protein